MNQEQGKKQRRRLSAEEKWQIYRECEQPGAKVGEILRKYGLYSSDLGNIRKLVKEGSLERLRQSKPGKKKVTTVPLKEYEQLESELARKEKALADRAELTFLPVVKRVWVRSRRVAVL